MTRRIDNPDTQADIDLRQHLSAEKRGCFVMVAGAGSGKTTSLVKALDYIGATVGSDLRKRGKKVACITYTEVAVGEIWGDVANSPLYHVSTIHSFLWSLVSPFQSDIASWVVIRMREKLAELQQEKVGFGPRVHQKTRDRNERSIARLERQIPLMSRVKAFTYGSGSNYSEGILGHDDILKMVPALIQKQPIFSTIVAQKYPIVFVDESQDTIPEVVEALKVVATQKPSDFCLGFFGDPMQKVYQTGSGEIVLGPGWRKIEKPENFRCPTKVLSVINAIRAKGDGLQQTRGRHEIVDGISKTIAGTARFFIMPTDDQRPANLKRVREWLAKTDADLEWMNDAEDTSVRILVIEHRMAAVRLGFENLHSAFRDDAPDSLSSAFRDGTAWPLRPFQQALIPLAAAISEGRDFDAMALLRKYSTRLSAERLKGSQKPSDVLAKIKADIDTLAKMMEPTSNSSVLDVLRFVREVNLVGMDDRLVDFIEPKKKEASEHQKPEVVPEEEKEDVERIDATIGRYFACLAREVPVYDKYQRALSPYSTQQGVKGAEFPRVIIVLDDDESKQFLISYDKLLGLKAPSKTDLQHQANGEESVFERTRRLLYVGCSRATRDLAIVLFTENVHGAAKAIIDSKMFEAAEVITVDMLKAA